MTAWLGGLWCETKFDGWCGQALNLSADISKYVLTQPCKCPSMCLDDTSSSGLKPMRTRVFHAPPSMLASHETDGVPSSKIQKEACRDNMLWQHGRHDSKPSPAYIACT